jgi:prepilin-type N-terminal cleavage/methylation domain-containing protein
VKITKKNGFSMLELIVVIAIFAIVAGIAALSWQRYVNNTNLRTAAREIATDINSMKEQAISKMDTTCTIVFNKTAGTYTMNGTTVETKSLTSFGPGIIINALPLGGAAYTLNFETWGLITMSAGSILDTITLKNNRGSLANINFNNIGKTYVTFTMQ